MPAWNIDVSACVYFMVCVNMVVLPVLLQKERLSVAELLGAGESHHTEQNLSALHVSLSPPRCRTKQHFLLASPPPLSDDKFIDP